MTLDEMLQAGNEYHSRGDAIGLYRFIRQQIADASSPHDEGIARAFMAEVMVSWLLGSPSTIEAELVRAKALLRSFPDDLAYALLVHLLWRAGENDVAAVQALTASYERLCAAHPDRPGVLRWRGRISSWLGRLALAQGDLASAVEHYERALVEYDRHEPDPGSREQMIRMGKLRLAEFALMRRDIQAARRLLDECEGSTISRLWETSRACHEVQYAILAGNAERARFWLKVAQEWTTPQSESAALLTLAQARVAYALGELHKAHLLTLEARRLAAQHKQDQLLPEIREFFRVQASGDGAGQLTRGGIPNDEAHGALAVPGPGSRALAGGLGRRQRL